MYDFNLEKLYISSMNIQWHRFSSPLHSPCNHMYINLYYLTPFSLKAEVISILFVKKSFVFSLWMYYAFQMDSKSSTWLQKYPKM